MSGSRSPACASGIPACLWGVWCCHVSGSHLVFPELERVSCSSAASPLLVWAWANPGGLRCYVRAPRVGGPCALTAGRTPGPLLALREAPLLHVISALALVPRPLCTLRGVWCLLPSICSSLMGHVVALLSPCSSHLCGFPRHGPSRPVRAIGFETLAVWSRAWPTYPPPALCFARVSVRALKAFCLPSSVCSGYEALTRCVLRRHALPLLRVFT